MFRFLCTRSDRFWQVALFLLTVALHTTLAVMHHSGETVKDEARYLEGAENLRQGFFVTSANPDFVNGPGYPLWLVPFGTSDAGLLAARISNSVLVGLAGVLLYRTIRRYAGKAWAVAVALLVVAHPVQLGITPFLMSEALALFCASAFAWSFTAALRENRKRVLWIALGAVSLAWLVMTRVIFGYVLLTMLPITAALLAVARWRPAMKRALAVFTAAFLLCTPYLAYTKAMTGRTLCWSTNSGELLYWFTSTRPGENGYWFAEWEVSQKPELAAHRDAYLPALKLPVLEREALLTTLAMDQLRAAPARVAYNWLCNLSRMVFGFPRSFQPEDVKKTGLVACNGLLILAAGAALVMGAFRWRGLPPEIVLLMCFALVFTGGSSLVPCLPRYFMAVVPVFWLGAAAILSQNVRVSLSLDPVAPPSAHGSLIRLRSSRETPMRILNADLPRPAQPQALTATPPAPDRVPATSSSVAA